MAVADSGHVLSLIEDHWAGRADLGFVEAQLARRGCDPNSPSVADLAAFDQQHGGQLEGTRRLAEWAGLTVQSSPGLRVLDVGSGLGGSARYLAQDHGCQVTALELCGQAHLLARELTQRTGLGHKVTHRHGDFLAVSDMELHDLVWIQHVDMHVEDKPRLYARCAELLTSQGRILWHDWLRGPGGEPLYPVVWSRDGAISFLSFEAEFRANLARAGLELCRFEILSDATHGWFATNRDRVAKAAGKMGDSEGGRRLDSLLEEIEGVVRNLEQHRLVPFFAEARPTNLVRAAG